MRIPQSKMLRRSKGKSHDQPPTAAGVWIVTDMMGQDLGFYSFLTAE